MFFAEDKKPPHGANEPIQGISTEGNASPSHNAKEKDFSLLTKLLILLIPLLLWVGYYTYSNVFGATSFGKTLSTNVDLERGLVGHWTFDGPNMNWSSTTAEVLDRTSNANHGNLVNAGATAATPGKIGQALRLNIPQLTSGAVNVPQNGKFNLSTTSFTIAFWTRDDALYAPLSTTFHRFISWYDGLNNIQVGIGGMISPGSTRQYYLFSSSTAVMPQKITSISGGITPGWHHVVARFDGTLYTLYVDGVESSGGTSALTTGAFVGNNTTLYIGQRGDAVAGTYTTGDIDDVRIYNRALSVAEVTALYKLSEGTHISTTLDTNDPLEVGLVGHWTFDGPNMNWSSTTAEVLDRTSNANHGNLFNSGSTAAVSGKIGQGMKFDGVDDYVDAGSPAVFDDIPIVTVSAWIKPISAGENNYGRIVDKGETSTEGFTFYTCDAAGVGCSTSNNKLAFYRGFSTTDGVWRTSSNITLNEWQHVVVTYDSSSVSNDPIFYINGILASTVEVATPVGTTDSDASLKLFIGSRSAADRSFNGSIDDVRIYNRALSETEVTRLYRLGIGSKI